MDYLILSSNFELYFNQIKFLQSIAKQIYLEHKLIVSISFTALAIH